MRNIYQSYVRKWIIVGCIIMAASPILSACIKPVRAQPNKYVCVSSIDGADVYDKEPPAKHLQLTHLFTHECMLLIRDENDAWVQIIIPEETIRTGYTRTENIRDPKEELPSSSYVTQYNADVFSQPTMDSQRLCQLGFRDKIEVKEKFDPQWYKIEAPDIGNEYGWILRDHVAERKAPTRVGTLVLDIGYDGSPRIANEYINDYFGIFFAIPEFVSNALYGWRLPPEFVSYLVEENVQHIQIHKMADHLQLSINGKSIRTASVDTEELIKSIENWGYETNRLTEVELSHILRYVEFGVAIRFPIGEGVDVIPLDMKSMPIPPPPVPTDQIASAKENLQLDINYRHDGTAVLANMTEPEFRELTGLLLSELALRPEFVQGLQNLNVKYLAIQNSGGTITVSVNGMPQLWIPWSDLTTPENTEFFSGLIKTNFVFDFLFLVAPTLEGTDFHIMIHIDDPSVS